MKKPLLFFAFLLASLLSQAQLKRYYDRIFDSVQVIPDQIYGNNYGFNSLNGEVGLTRQDLTLDIYLPPATDEVVDRPLIIWAHGGSFLGGTKADRDIVFFCNEYAKRGFVCASINYRIGYELPIDSIRATRTVFRALQDGRAAVRYMRSRAGEFNIDKSRVYFGGTSAGGFIAVNLAYLNLPEEVPAYVDTLPHDSIHFSGTIGIDGIEGLTNTLPESSEIMGIINYCGATKVTSWMDDEYSRNVPIISMHGTRDSTVPYATRVIKLNDLTPIPQEVPIPIVQVQGSYDIDRHADKMGYMSKFYTWYGADHVPYINYDDGANGAAYMDTVMRFTLKHVYEVFLGGDEVDGLDENRPPCDFNNGQEDPCAITSVEKTDSKTAGFYPNPFNNELVLQHLATGTSISITDITGKMIYSAKVSSANQTINTSAFHDGIYILKTSAGSFKICKN